MKAGRRRRRRAAERNAPVCSTLYSSIRTRIGSQSPVITAISIQPPTQDLSHHPRTVYQTVSQLGCEYVPMSLGLQPIVDTKSPRVVHSRNRADVPLFLFPPKARNYPSIAAAVILSRLHPTRRAQTLPVLSSAASSLQNICRYRYASALVVCALVALDLAWTGACELILEPFAL